MTTFTATAPGGETYARSSKTRTYTHARWLQFPGEETPVIISWHQSAEAAAKSPFQVPTWKTLPHGIVEVEAR